MDFTWYLLPRFYGGRSAGGTCLPEVMADVWRAKRASSKLWPTFRVSECTCPKFCATSGGWNALGRSYERCLASGTCLLEVMADVWRAGYVCPKWWTMFRMVEWACAICGARFGGESGFARSGGGNSAGGREKTAGSIRSSAVF